MQDRGIRDINVITLATLTDMKTWMRERAGRHEQGVSYKTAKNCIAGTLQAFFRDMTAEGRVKRNPFRDIPRRTWWGRSPAKPVPNPLTEEERDMVLDYYRKIRPEWQFEFLFFLAWTGCRPSEACALVWHCIDFRLGTIDIRESRSHLGDVNNTETGPSVRTIHPLRKVMDRLKLLKPKGVSEFAPVFTNSVGLPVDQSEFGKEFIQALRDLEIRKPKRKETKEDLRFAKSLYNIRHTWISVALTAGVPPKQVAEEDGTSLLMLQEYYGKYMGGAGNSALEAYLEARESKGVPEAETTATESGFAPKASPTTFERL